MWGPLEMRGWKRLLRPRRWVQECRRELKSPAISSENRLKPVVLRTHFSGFSLSLAQELIPRRWFSAPRNLGVSPENSATAPSGRVNSAAAPARLLKQATLAVLTAHDPQDQPTVRFSGRARQAREFTPRRYGTGCSAQYASVNRSFLSLAALLLNAARGCGDRGR